jgi:hypothetical protein
VSIALFCVCWLPPFLEQKEADVAEEAGSVMPLEQMTLMVLPMHGLMDVEVWVYDPARALNQNDHLSVVVLATNVEKTVEGALPSALQPRGPMGVLSALGIQRLPGGVQWHYAIPFFLATVDGEPCMLAVSHFRIVPDAKTTMLDDQ